MYRIVIHPGFPACVRIFIDDHLTRCRRVTTDFDIATLRSCLTRNTVHTSINVGILVVWVDYQRDVITYLSQVPRRIRMESILKCLDIGGRQGTILPAFIWV